MLGVERNIIGGLKNVKLLDPGGDVSRTGRGLFATALRANYPDLPVAEETDLEIQELRADFIKKVMAYTSR